MRVVRRRGGFWRRPAFWRLAIPSCLILAVWVLVAASHHLQGEIASPYPLAPTLPYHPILAALGLPGIDPDSLAQVRVPFESTLRRGETLARVLERLGLDRGEAHVASQSAAAHVDLRRLKAGERYAALFDDEENLYQFSLFVSGDGRLDLARRGDDWEGEWRAYERTVLTRSLDGLLDDALETSIRHAGGQATLAYRMADVLQWDLDFNRDLRQGDRFRVLYEELLLDGEFHRVGEVLALIYENRGRRLEGYLFGEEGYYDGKGRPLRKMFLRSPLPYSRVTSRFSRRRFHPVLKTYRPHYGVDYGAPAGTSVRVTASGVVTSVGWDGGGGKTVKVRHPNGYLTAYLHLSRYARGIRPGRRVEQGRVIGYVGSTGLATGSHLDYRVQYRGRWINPMSLKNHPAEPIPPGRMDEFIAWRDTLRHSLEEAGVSPDSLPPSRIAATQDGRLRSTRRSGR